MFVFYLCLPHMLECVCMIEYACVHAVCLCVCVCGGGRVNSLLIITVIIFVQSLTDIDNIEAFCQGSCPQNITDVYSECPGGEDIVSSLEGKLRSGMLQCS